MAPVTVGDIMGMAFPRGTVLKAGEKGLNKQVTWARTLRTRVPAFDALEGGEVALLSTRSISLLDEQLTLSYVIRSLAGLSVSAMAVEGEIDWAAVETAEELCLPLFHLPAGTNLRVVEKSVISLIVNRQAELQHRGTQIYRELAQLALEDRGLPAIALRLSQIAGKIVIIEDEDFRVICIGGAEALPDRERLPEMLLSGRALPRWIGTVALTSTSPPVLLLPCGESEYSRFVSPIIVREVVAGYVSIMAPHAELEEIDRVATSRSAAVCAMEMSKHLAIMETENRLRGGIVDDLLAGSIDDEPTMIARAKQLGHDITLPHAVVVVATERPDGASMDGWEAGQQRAARILERRIERAFTRNGLHPLCRPRGTKTVVLVPLPSDKAEKALKTLVEEAHRELTDSHLMALVSIGVGRLYSDINDLKKAYREAEQALLVGQKLYGKGHWTLFGDLGIYRLFFHLKGTPELADLNEETIAKIAAYDQKHDSELLKTLETFFHCLGNLSRTAETLYLHRNTLIYRMERIQEITGLDLDDAESRLCLQVALKMRMFN